MKQSSGAWAIAVVVLTLMSGAATAATSVRVPAGTQMSLVFVDPVDTGTAKVGQTVRLKVGADVVVHGYVVIRKGAGLAGTVTFVRRAGASAHPATATVGHLSVLAVDKMLVELSDVTIAANKTSIGLLGGGVVEGGNVRFPAGVVVTGSATETVTIAVP